MARTTTPGCMCRVPLSEGVAPQFSTNAELSAWADAHDVEILPDYRGRPSVDMPTAYRLHAEATAASADAARVEAERVAKEKAEIDAAQQRRQETFTAAHERAIARGRGHAEASQAGWEAVHKVEQGLPARVRDRLAPVRARAVSYSGQLIQSGGGSGVA